MSIKNNRTLFIVASFCHYSDYHHMLLVLAEAISTKRRKKTQQNCLLPISLYPCSVFPVPCCLSTNVFISTGNFECYGVTPKQSHQQDNNYFQLAEFFLTIFVYFHSPQKHLSSIFFCKNMLVFNKISARELCFFQCFPCFVLGVILTLIEQISE